MQESKAVYKFAKDDTKAHGKLLNILHAYKPSLDQGIAVIKFRTWFNGSIREVVIESRLDGHGVPRAPGDLGA